MYSFPRLTVTWDVLKYKNTTKSNKAIKINRNMGCIEILFSLLNLKRKHD